MAAYLIDHPPVRDQFYKTRNRPLTGCTVLHTAESALDTVGPDTGAEAVAEFIRTRTTPGSYHDLADSDSYMHLVPYESGAYHDGTGSNNWALSISFACGTHHWRTMTAEKRRGFLRQGARAFAAQQAWRKARGYPLTELRYITKAQSDAGASGFIEHGRRDPGRRTDPGIAAPNLFPYDEWLEACRAALAGTDDLEDDMPLSDADIEKVAQRVRQVVADGTLRYGLDSLRRKLDTLLGKPETPATVDPVAVTAIAAAVVAQLPSSGGQAISPEAVAAAVVDRLGASLTD